MSNSQTVYLSSTISQKITGFSPFTLTIDPSSIPLPGKIYKISYDFGDGTLIERNLTTDNESVFLKTFETYVYNLTSNLQQDYNININAYQFNSSYYLNYNINLNLRTPPLETISLVTSSVSAAAYFNELHLVGSRMFGTEDEILYMFESINPNYLLPVLVNWKARPIESIVKNIDGYLSYKLLAPFENEATTSIDTGTNIVTFPDVDAAPNPDYGNPTMKVYDGFSYGTKFLGTVNGDWFDLDNWKSDINNNANILPDEFISVKVFSPITLSSLNVGKALNIDFLQDTLLKQLTIMVSQSAIFHSNSYNFGTIQGDAYFLDNSYNYGISATLLSMDTIGVDGSQIFTDSSGYNRILTYTGNPYITSLPITPNTIITDGLAFEVDAEGYTGDGTTWIDTVNGVVGTAQNSPIYVANSPSYFDFSGESQCFNFPKAAFCSVLMHFNDINGSTTFTDSSDNNLTFDQNIGSPVISTDQSVFGGSSLYLDGSSCIATANNGLFTFATNDTTYEAWVYLTDYPTGDNWPSQWYNTFSVICVGSPNTGDGFNLVIGQTQIFCNNNDAKVAAGTHNMSLNTWYHVAAVFKSGVLSVYVNGNLTGSQTIGSLGGGSVFTIGSETKQGAYFKGYIDEVRVYNGYAKYTSNFTPPTSELTKDVPPQINVDFNNNFSLETWVNIRGNNEWGGIISLATGGYEDFGGEQYSLNTTYDQHFRFNVNSGSYLNSIDYTLNKWTHIITTYQDGVVKTYKNGILADEQTIASTVNSLPNAYLALGVNQYGQYEYLNGKIATARIYNKILSDTEVVQNFNATKDRFINSYPSGSFAFFDGSSHVYPTSGGDDFAFGTEDFTIEAWIFPTRNKGISQVFYDTRFRPWEYYPMMFLRSGVYLTFGNGSWWLDINGDRVGTFEWSHVAVSRKDGKSKLFINGVQTGQTADDTNNYKSNNVRPIIGGSFDDNYNYKGFIKDFHVTKKLARYTQNFTPPSAPIDNIYITGNVTGTAHFRDNSVNYGTLTNTVFSGISAFNFGIVENADVYFPTPVPLGGTITGNISYHGYTYGCTDPTASNYDPSANIDDGSCTFIYGCTNPYASNYNPSAGRNDGSCIYPSLSSGLIAYYNMNELDGTRVDVTGHGYNINEVGGTVYSGNGILDKSAYIVDSSVSYLQLPTNICNPQSPTKEKTYSIWFKLLDDSVLYTGHDILASSIPNYDDYGGIYTFNDDNTGENLYFFVQTTKQLAVNLISNKKVTLNEWHHVVVTIIDKTVKLYHNGDLVATATIASDNQFVNDNSGYTLGWSYAANYNGLENYSPLYVDELGIWNRALKDSDVSSLYNGGLALQYPF